MKTYSLARQLILMVLLVELTSALCVTGVAFFYERHTHFHSFDIMLRGRADSLLGAVQDAGDAHDNVMLDGSEVTLPQDDIYEVKDATGRILGHSANWTGFVGLHPPDAGGTFESDVNAKTYRILHLTGLRIVDPDEKDGGVRRYVSIYYGSPVKRAWKAVFKAVTFYAFSSLLVLAITGVLMSWLLNRGLSPLRDLAAGASTLTVNSWTFNPPDRARRTTELAPLVNALESALKRLEHSFEQQKRFVGDAAHELKTAVAVVKSSLQLLGMKQRTAAEYQTGLDRCLSDCSRMEEIVAQMLTLARLEERSERPLENLTADMVSCAQIVVQQLHTIAFANEMHVQLHSPNTLGIAVDPEEVRLVCTNLLLNAMQHSKRGSDIYIHLLLHDHFAEMRIVDSGEGIDARDLSKIFDRFSRIDPSRSRKTGGTGLGLAICKAIAEKYAGSISIQSDLNVGTAVTVLFPLISMSSEGDAFRLA